MKTPDIPPRQMPVRLIDPFNDRNTVASNHQAIDPKPDKAASDNDKSQVLEIEGDKKNISNRNALNE